MKYSLESEFPEVNEDSSYIILIGSGAAGISIMLAHLMAATKQRQVSIEFAQKKCAYQRFN